MEIPSVVLHKNETESTMDDARAAILAGYGHGTACSASLQWRGRGRLPGRRWENGTSALLFTLILSRDALNITFPPTQLLALALCRHLEEAHHLRPEIKWPNDVLIDGKKIAGILVETEGDFFLAGMGLNLQLAPVSPEYRYPVVGLADITSHLSSPTDEMQKLCGEIHRCLERPPAIDEIGKRLSGVGSEVTVALGDPSENNRVRGKVLGLATDGALRIDAGREGVQAIYSGEIDYSKKS